MALTTVYFKTPDGIAKAIVDVKEIPFFVQFGACRTPEAAEKKSETEQPEDKNADASETVEEDISNPDKGPGRPGSLSFHKHSIMAFETVGAVSGYLQDVTGQCLDARIKKIDKAQKAAITIIKDWLKNERQNA